MAENIIVYEIRANNQFEGEKIKACLGKYEGISADNAKISVAATCLSLPAVLTYNKIIEGDYIWTWLLSFKAK